MAPGSVRLEALPKLNLGFPCHFDKGTLPKVLQLGLGSLVDETIMMRIMTSGTKYSLLTMHRAQFHTCAHVLPYFIFTAAILYSWHYF